MTTRDITIWTTFILLLLTLIFPAVAFYIDFPSPEYYDTHPPGKHIEESIIFLPIAWFLISWPLLISYVVAKSLQCEASCGILLGVTIGYALFYATVVVVVIDPDPYKSIYFCFGGLSILTLLSIPVMVPMWITVVVKNAYYVKPTPNPETAAQEDLPPPSPPTPLEDQNDQ